MGTVSLCLCILLFFSIFKITQGRNIFSLRTSKMVKRYLLWNVFLLIYVYFLLQFFGEGNGITPLKDYIQMIIILPIFYVSGNLLFKNIDELMKVLYLGVIIQSLIIIAALFIPLLTLFLFALIPEGGYNTEHFGGINMITQHGYHIGLGVFTSAGSIKMGIGQIGACYYLIKGYRKELLFHIFIYFLITVAASVISRTGLLISVVGLIVVFFAKYKQKKHAALKFGLLVFCSLFICINILSCILPSSFFSDTFIRIIDLSERGARDTYFAGFTGEVGENMIPPISDKTLIGLGITYGVSGTGIATYTDGGFLRNYSAMGLIVAIINYFLIFSLFKKQYNMNHFFDNKSVILLLFFILLIGEFKESCIYFIYPICFFFLIFAMMEKQEQFFSTIDINNNLKK